MSYFTCNFAHMNTSHCKLTKLTSEDLSQEVHVEGRGGIVLCESGWCKMQINFTEISMYASESITLYPTDIIVNTECSEDFSATAFWYDEGMLRGASIHIEESVYSALRKDRICKEKTIVDNVIRPMFTILKHFFSLDKCEVLDDIAISQLKSFFIGFYDFIRQHPSLQPMHTDSQRTNELFARFMHDLEHYYKESRDVQYYADRLFITRKYLGIIVNRKSGKTPKQLIDEYVMMQLKIALRNTNDSIKQIATAFHFTDDSLLIRYFRAHTGMTPVQYRRGN